MLKWIQAFGILGNALQGIFTGERNCLHCRESIPSGATVCPFCRHHPDLYDEQLYTQKPVQSVVLPQVEHFSEQKTSSWIKIQGFWYPCKNNKLISGYQWFKNGTSGTFILQQNLNGQWVMKGCLIPNYWNNDDAWFYYDPATHSWSRASLTPWYMEENNEYLDHF